MTLINFITEVSNYTKTNSNNKIAQNVIDFTAVYGVDVNKKLF